MLLSAIAEAKKEVALLASCLKMARNNRGKNLEIIEMTPARQCEPEFALELAEIITGVDAVLSLSCGVGVQTLARNFNTTCDHSRGKYCFYG